MKLERLFKVENQKLYTVSGEAVPTDGKAFPVKWSDVEGESEEYKEDFLAGLREQLKELEEKGSFVFIEPLFDKSADYQQFTAAMKHCARRIKDCVSVIGFAIPEEIFEHRSFYIEKLSAKHQQYCFFCRKSQDSNIVFYN